MMARKLLNKLLVLVCLAATFTVRAEDGKVLTRAAFLGIVRTYHPIVKQADMQVQRANAEVTRVRGAFDPTLNAGLDRKTFNGKLYYSYFKPELNIPTWYGIELKAGFEEAIGDRLTSEVSPGVTSFVGMKVPVTSLVYDKRRAALQQAKLFAEVSEAERKLMINTLIYDAVVAYLNWTRDYTNYTTVNTLVAANEQRMKLLRVEVEQGARPAIDTIEARGQYDILLQQLYNNFVSYRNAGLELSNYMWLENNEPATLGDGIIPDTTELNSAFPDAEVPSLNYLVEESGKHPKLQSISSKIGVLELDRKLKQQGLLPKLSVNANLLSKGYGIKGDVTADRVTDNNKVGLEFSMPLFLREARGSLSSAKLKIAETEQEKNQTELTITNKVKSYYYEFLSLQQQVDAFSRAMDNYRKVYNGEYTRFLNGESTLFMVNTREMKMLETAQKLVELKAKYKKAYTSMFYATGTLQ